MKQRWLLLEWIPYTKWCTFKFLSSPLLLKTIYLFYRILVSIYFLFIVKSHPSFCILLIDVLNANPSEGVAVEQIFTKRKHISWADVEECMQINEKKSSTISLAPYLQSNAMTVLSKGHLLKPALSHETSHESLFFFDWYALFVCGVSADFSFKGGRQQLFWNKLSFTSSKYSLLRHRHTLFLQSMIKVYSRLNR